MQAHMVRMSQWRSVLISGGLLLALSLAALASHLFGVGMLPFVRGSRMGAYQRLWRALDRYYAYWDMAPVTPKDLKTRYDPEIAAADAACRGQSGPCQPYRQALTAMLAELQDGHTRLVPLPPHALPPIAVREIEGRAAIVWVAPDSAAEAAGLTPGDIIVAVDGMPVADALQRVPAWAIAFAAPHTRRYKAYANLLLGEPDSLVTLTVEDAAGISREVTLRRQPLPKSTWQPVESRRLEDGWGYIAVRTLQGGPGLVKAFDAALDNLLDTPGLILDLRSNGGGNSLWGERMVGRLITETMPYGEECFRARHPMHRWVRGCHELRVTPRGKPYRGPVAVLVNTNVHSSAEWMAVALCTTGRARCFGRTTAGNTGNPVPFYLPDATVYYSTGDFHLLDGSRLNGSGIRPHEITPWTLEDIRAGHDPDLEAARAWLKATLSQK